MPQAKSVGVPMQCLLAKVFRIFFYSERECFLLSFAIDPTHSLLFVWTVQDRIGYRLKLVLVFVHRLL